MAKASTTCTYDYIELKIFDVHGYPRGRIISESQFPGVIKDGMGMRHGEFKSMPPGHRKKKQKKQGKAVPLKIRCIIQIFGLSNSFYKVYLTLKLA